MGTVIVAGYGKVPVPDAPERVFNRVLLSAEMPLVRLPHVSGFCYRDVIQNTARGKGYSDTIAIVSFLCPRSDDIGQGSRMRVLL